jgi:predicted ATPase
MAVMPGRRLTNLASAEAPLFGREADAAALEARFAEGRLVTITGPGGVGKTRLARRFSARRGGGAWFCDLTSCADASGIVAAVAATLRVKVATGARDPAAALGEAIARRGRVLVVLDNFERLVAHARGTLGVWLEAAPSARFLATSRVPTGVAGELLFPLDPLARGDAAELFGARVRALVPGFDLEAERDTVTSIVDAIDRLPLAIELAATRMTVLSAPQLLEATTTAGATARSVAPSSTRPTCSRRPRGARSPRARRCATASRSTPRRRCSPTWSRLAAR